MSVAVTANAIRPQRRPAIAVIRDYVALMKPNIIVLLEITTICAMVMAQRGWPAWGLLVATVLGGALAAGGANAINCYIDCDIDGIMARTQSRPLPSGRIDRNQALAFGVGLGVASFLILSLAVNLLAASLTMAALLFYVLVYTLWLKRRFVQNIVIGGAAGALPPVIGWAAVQGHLDSTALFLFAVVFFWTPPHFWALALLMERDYASVHVPMLPVVVGRDQARRQIVLYTVVLTVVTVLPFLAHSFGWTYLVGALILDGIFLVGAGMVVAKATAAAARWLFGFSIIYLAALFAVMAVDRILVVG